MIEVSRAVIADLTRRINARAPDLPPPAFGECDVEAMLYSALRAPGGVARGPSEQRERLLELLQQGNDEGWSYDAAADCLLAFFGAVSPPPAPGATPEPSEVGWMVGQPLSPEQFAWVKWARAALRGGAPAPTATPWLVEALEDLATPTTYGIDSRDAFGDAMGRADAILRRLRSAPADPMAWRKDGWMRPAETPADLERDRLWCRAIVAAGLDAQRINDVTRIFNGLRASDGPPPYPVGYCATPAETEITLATMRPAEGPTSGPESVNRLANIIRTVDGSNALGAGALAERLIAACVSPPPSFTYEDIETAFDWGIEIGRSVRGDAANG